MRRPLRRHQRLQRLERSASGGGRRVAACPSTCRPSSAKAMLREMRPARARQPQVFAGRSYIYSTVFRPVHNASEATAARWGLPARRHSCDTFLRCPSEAELLDSNRRMSQPAYNCIRAWQLSDVVCQSRLVNHSCHLRRGRNRIALRLCPACSVRKCGRSNRGGACRHPRRCAG